MNVYEGSGVKDPHILNPPH